MTDLVLPIRRLDKGLPLPGYAYANDGAIDLCTRIDLELAPGQRQHAPTGLALAIPVGFVGLVAPRSGLAARHGLSLVNTPGVIDAGYRGELQVLLLNTDRQDTISLKRGDRVAQLLLVPVAKATVVEVDQLPDSQRGQGGWGSSGGVEAWIC
ncbi:MAG: dUTP diphosphatase [Propionibacteriaceae bacterium]|jgi:dUTP pyrophosphatase|nr:dUTP diphosphatase [Propionibacteriaceae bacterium]